MSSIAYGSPSASVESVLSSHAEWRLVLCHRNGDAIRILDNIAVNRQFKFQLNRAASLTFDVPSDAEEVNGITNDGFPHLEPLDRTIRAYRKSPITRQWDLRLNGIVWQVGDAEDGGGAASHTTVTVFDPFKFLEKRLVCHADGGFVTTVNLPSADLGQTVYTMLARSHDNFGSHYLRYQDGPWTTGTVLDPPLYDQRYIAQAIIEFCDTGSMDFAIDPLGPGMSGYVPGILGRFTAMAERGQDKSDRVTFGYDIGNFGANRWSRSMNGDTAANDITNIGGTNHLHSNAQDTDSQDRFGVMQSAEVLTGVSTQNVLDSMTAWELGMRKGPQDIVAFTPRPDLTPTIFDFYFLGDRVKVACSDSVREAISGIQRVYGVTLNVGDEGDETVDELILSASQESS